VDRGEVFRSSMRDIVYICWRLLS